MADSRTSDLTLLIPASPIPSHPNTAVIERALDSLLTHLPDGAFRTIVCHDPPSPSLAPDRSNAFERYLQRLERLTAAGKYRRLDIDVTTAPRWGHLAGSLRHTIGRVQSEFVFILQHDFFLTEHLPILDLIEMMRRHPEVKHLRLNRKANLPRLWDGRTEERRRFFAERSFDGVRVCQTLAWSDNPHLARTEYYSDLILPLVGDRQTFPENVCDPLNTPESHAQFGTFVYGAEGQASTVGHLDGAAYIPPSRFHRTLIALRGGLRLGTRLKALLRR